MKKIEINVQEPYYSHIVSGQKTIEGRLNKGKFLEIQEGDELVINDENRYRVTAKRVYPSFAEMIKAEGIENVIPGAKTVDEAVTVYYKFYTPEKEVEFGVAAIEISPLSVEAR